MFSKLAPLVTFAVVNAVVYKVAKNLIVKYDAQNVENNKKENVFGRIDLDPITYKTVKSNDSDIPQQ